MMHNVAVVGCGYWGPNLIRNFRSLNGVAVMKICDCNAERLNHMAQMYPEVKSTTVFSDVVSDPKIDLVAIATPVRTHASLALQCLRAGKHVFIEKPLASSMAECRELIAEAERRGCTLMVGHTFIYTPMVRMIKEIVDSGEIGDIMYISCRRLNLGLFQKDINVAWDLAPHDLSIILYLMKGSPISVNCQGKAHITPGIEDITSMTLSFQNGGLATIQSSWIDPRKVRELTIVGERKMIVYDDTEPLEKIKIYDKSVERPPHYDTFGEFHYSYHYGDILSPFIKMTEPLKAECQHFIDCIDQNLTPDSSGLDGLRVVEILEAATKSLKNGGEMVRLEAVAPELRVAAC